MHVCTSFACACVDVWGRAINMIAFFTYYIYRTAATYKWFIHLLLYHPLPLIGAYNVFSIDSTPTLQAVRKFIVREVAIDWSLVAIYLGLESSVIKLTAAVHPQHCEHACLDVFDRWLSWEPGTGERDRTWHTVLSAMEDAGHKAYTQRLKTGMFSLQ